MFQTITSLRCLATLAGGIGLWALQTLPAQAVPSFSRQTGQECATCHIGSFGPQLTPYGMKFKLEGYTESNGKGPLVPLSGMLVASSTHTSKDQSGDAGPHAGPNDNTVIQEVSGFLAGRLTDHLGSFTQVTYSGIERKVALDNLDLRFTQNLKLGDTETLVGVTLNNNPTVQDPFNTQPAWRFPYMGSELAPGPAAAPLLNGGLGQQVLGASLYGLWNDSIYAELGAYGGSSYDTLKAFNITKAIRLDGLSPYARIGYFKDLRKQAFGGGLVAMQSALKQDGTSRTDKYQDIGLDGWYQWLGNRQHIFTLHGSYLHEDQTRDASYDLGAAENRKGKLDRLDLGGSYHFDQSYGVTLGYFNINGDSDGGLYAPEPDSGSLNGSPNSNGWTVQADWTRFGKENSWGAPWANVRLGLQYTAYGKFNGASRDYDGSGRDASDNNTLFGFLWTAF